MTAWGDFYRAASAASVEACGLQVAEIGGAVATMAAAVDVLALNRVLGIGVKQPATESEIDEIIRLFTERRVPRFFVQVSPVAAPDDLPRMLEDRGFRHYNNWVRLYRDVSAPPDVKTDLAVRRIDEEDAAAFGRIVAESFGWGDQISGWIGDLVGKLGWRHYMAFDGDTPVATGAMRVAGEYAWLDFAATLSDHRKRGAQGAILARRIRDAATQGCRYVLVETAEQTAEKEVPSYRNMLRFGFTEAYVRPNYIFYPQTPKARSACPPTESTKKRKISKVRRLARFRASRLCTDHCKTAALCRTREHLFSPCRRAKRP